MHSTYDSLRGVRMAVSMNTEAALDVEFEVEVDIIRCGILRWLVV